MTATDLTHQCCACHAVYSPTADAWAPLDAPLSHRLEVSHGYCPDRYAQQIAELQKRRLARKAA